MTATRTVHMSKTRKSSFPGAVLSTWTGALCERVGSLTTQREEVTCKLCLKRMRLVKRAA